MAWVEFSADFRFTPAADRRATIKYLAGKRYSVTRECAAKAIEARAAVRIPAPPRGGFNGADPAAFDHDGDGAPGGSRKGARRAGR